jgi:hypothetical protein
MWLAFTYMGAVLLVTWKPIWIRRLAGVRMARTDGDQNCMIQIILLDLLFAKYALACR